jgi:hypothetical protein
MAEFLSKDKRKFFVDGHPGEKSAQKSEGFVERESKK